jgi:nitrite reductase/ring-hydroxylating ferredoxin subunit
VSDELPWQRLDGIDVDGAFPARAKLAGEGILVFRTPTGFRGVERTCPHLKSTLIDATLVGNGAMIRCAQHNYTFKLADGKGVNCPGFRLKVYEVKSEDGSLVARVIA